MSHRNVVLTLSIDGVQYTDRQILNVEVPMDFIEERATAVLAEMFEQHHHRTLHSMFSSEAEWHPGQWLPVNPILAAFREREMSGNPFALVQWLNFLGDGWDGSICAATPNEVDHARKVLTRLANLSKEN